MFGWLFGIVGWLFGGPTFGLITSIVGQLLFGKKKSGDKVDAVQYTGVDYGDDIHWISGKMRVGGTIFWPSNLLLRPHTIKGKTSGFLFWETQETPDIQTYKATWATLLTYCPKIDGETEYVDTIDQIWMNGDLRFDISDDADTTLKTRSQAMLTATTNGIRIVLGSDFQDVDSIMATTKDPGDPTDDPYEEPIYGHQIAYRHRCFIIFVNWILNDFGNSIPQINARVVKKGHVKPSKWRDETRDTEKSRVNHVPVIAFDTLYITGGYIYDGASYLPSDLCTAYTFNADTGALTAGSSTSMCSMTRADHGAVYVPNYLQASGKRYGRLVVMGGYNDGGTINEDPHTGYMMAEWDKSNWTCCPVYSDDGGYTGGRLPFPRDSFGCCFLEITSGYCLYDKCVFVFGGRTPETAANYSWSNGGHFQDLWAWNGGTWYLLTPLYTEDGVTLSRSNGMGYRIYPASCQHGDSIYAGGGLDPVVEEIAENKRDIYILEITPSITEISPEYCPCTFRCVCSDILEGYPTWENPENYFVNKLISHMGDLIAVLSNDGLSSTAAIFFKSKDGLGYEWELWNRGQYSLASIDTVNYKFTVAENITDYLVVGDSITILSTAGHLLQYRVEAVELSGSSTEVTVNSTGIVLEMGDMFIDYYSRYNLSITDAYNISIYDWTGGSALYPLTFSVTSYKGHLVIIGSGKTGVIGGEDYLRAYTTYPLEAELDADISLSKVVRDVCALNGVTKDLVDTSDLDDQTLHGVVFDRSSGKDRINILRQYGFFDMVMRDRILRAVTRGKDVVDTIEADYLGAQTVDSSDTLENPQRALITRKNQNTIPLMVECTFFNPDRDYQQSTQSCMRHDVPISQKVTNVNFTIAMTDAKASQIAEVLLYESLFDSIKIETSLRFLRLIPTDCVTVQTDTEIFRVLIDKITISPEDILSIEGRIEDTTVYTAKQIGASGSFSRPGMQLCTLTGIFLDVPWMWGEDAAGFLWGVYPATEEDESNFAGASLYNYDATTDTYYFRTSVNQYVDRGVVTGTLPDYLPTEEVLTIRQWDYVNDLIVTMSTGTLTSASSYTDLQNDPYLNLLAVGSEANGWEILQFLTAAYDSVNGYYVLSGLRRYCFGTEQITHAASDIVYVLDPDKFSLVKMNDTAKGVEVTYSTVPSGVDPIYGSTKAFTCNFINKKPFAPWQVYIARNTSLYYQIAWLWRNRGPGLNWQGWDADMPPVPFPVDLFTEQYLWREKEHVFEIDFYNEAGTEVVYTKRINMLKNMSLVPQDLFQLLDRTEYYSNGTSQVIHGQNSVYGASVATLKIKIYQISSEFGGDGRGYGTTIIFPTSYYTHASW